MMSEKLPVNREKGLAALVASLHLACFTAEQYVPVAKETVGIENV